MIGAQKTFLLNIVQTDLNVGFVTGCIVPVFFVSL
jgi:hypothetical protein